MKKITLLMSLLLTAFAVFAQDTIKLPETLIPTNETQTTSTVKFPAVTAQKGCRVILKGRFFYKGEKVSGWNLASSIKLNGVPLQAVTRDNKMRLLRRGDSMKLVNKSQIPYWNRHFMLIVYGSDNNAFDKRISPESQKEGYWYYLDITDLVSGKKENVMQITNGMRAIGKLASLKSYVLACKDMEVFQMPEVEADKLRKALAAPQAPKTPEAAPQKLRTKAELLASGDMLLPEVSMLPRPSPWHSVVKFPALRRVKGKKPILKSLIYFNTPKTSGWNNTMSISINGKQLTRYNAQGEERLLRRGTYMKNTFGKREWFSNGVAILVFFGPGKGEVDKRILEPRAEGYTYYLDISDMVNYVELGLDDRIESDKENVMQITNGMTSSPRNGSLAQSALTFKDTQIVWMTDDEINKVRPQQPLLTVTPAPVAAKLENGSFLVKVTTAGGLILERNGEKYYYNAGFSYPAKPSMKFNTLDVSRAEGVKGWKSQIKQSGDTIIITAAAADRKVQRTLKFNGKLLEISDSVTNLTDKDLPLMSKFYAISEDKIAPNDLFLAGMQGITQETACGSNPTLYIRGKKSGFGAMALEDAFRCHMSLARSGANQAELQHPTALAPKETYTQKQLVMLTNNADYFEFINELRRHLKLNHTINGPIALGGRIPPKSLQLRVSMAITKPQWFEYGGVDSLRRPRSVFIEQYRASKKAQDAAIPGVTVLAYTENSPATVDKSKLAGKELLPANPEKSLTGTYGQPISKEATAILDKTPWADSILRTADGRAIIDTYYAQGPDMLSLLVYPYKDNHYKKVLFERTRFLLDEANTDGIYIDQFANGTMYAVERSRDRISYEKWDGRTVILNPDGSIKEKLFDVGFACSKTRADYIRYVTSRGKFFLANTQPVTTTEAAAGGVRFYESDSENLAAMLTSTSKPPTYRLQAFAQLSPSPVLLGSRPARFNKDRSLWPKMYNRAFIGGLRHGLLYIHYGWSSALKCYGLVNHMFPITPEELGEGFIIGKERIITAVSRKFITAVEPKRIIGFDAEGNDLANVATVKKLAHNKFEVDVKLNDWNSSCVIVLEGYANAAEEQADIKKKSNTAMRKIALPEGEKVLVGPSRSCKYPDDASYEIGNTFRFHTKNGEGLAERVAEIIRTKTPFMLNEQITRQALRRPVDKMYEGAILPAEIQKIVASAGDLFLGRSIVGEYGGMLYWTKNSLGDLPCPYPRLKPAKDLVEAQANFYKQVKEFGDKERQLGCEPLLGVCSAMIFPPMKNKVYDKFVLEMMPGDPERLSSAIRGASRAYSKKEFYTLIAHGWYGGGLWDDLYFKRLRNAMNYAYIAGFKAIFSESGHFGFDGYGNKVERSDAEAARFRKEMSDFLQFCETDRRPLGGPDTPVAFLRGNLDGFPGLWASCVWGQFDDPAFANGDAEYGWELTKAIYTKRPWFDNMLRGKVDNSGQAPCGMYDIIPPDVPQEQLKRYKFVMIPGWNTMNDELYAKLKKYVEDGGTLLMSLAQMRSNIKRNEAIKLYKNGDFSDLFGVSLNQNKTIRVNGLKFTATDSFDGRLLWPDWTLYADPKFSESDFQAASVKSSAARVIAQASNNFEGNTLDKPEEKVPVLFEYRLGKGRAFLINSMEFPGSRNMFNFNRVVMSELMRAFQPADCQIECSTNIRYAVYGKPLSGNTAKSAVANKTVFYVMNTDYDFDGFFKLNGKTYQIKPQELRRIELDQK